MEQNINWKQLLSNYEKALFKLNEAVVRMEFFSIKENKFFDKVLDEILKDGLIHRFEYTFDLACSLMTDYAKFQGNSDSSGNRDAISEALQLELINDWNLWMDMITSRIRIPNSYDESIANEISKNIMKIYHPAFLEFQRVIQKRTLTHP